MPGEGWLEKQSGGKSGGEGGNRQKSHARHLHRTQLASGSFSHQLKHASYGKSFSKALEHSAGGKEGNGCAGGEGGG